MGELKPIKIKVFYDSNLEKITGKKEEPAIISEGMNFAFFLSTIFSSYPTIQEKYPPGTFGFLLNNKKPNGFEILSEGDEIIFKTL